MIGKKAKGDGTTEYIWREVGEDHDALDSIGQALAAYASMGFSTGMSGRQQRRYIVPKKKPRIKVI